MPKDFGTQVFVMLRCLLGVLAVVVFSFCNAAASTLDLHDEIRSYSSLNGATVNMTGRSELRLTGAGTPLSGCQIHLNSPEAWLFLHQVKPSVVNSSAYLSQIRVNGAAAVLNSNIRIVQYVTGAVVIPHAPSYQPLEVFSGIHFTGQSMKMGLYTYYRTSQLGSMNNAISSFRLKRGYMATFAQAANGTGVSRVFIAKDRDLDIGMMTPELNNSVSFVRVFPWRWVSQKGWGGGAHEANALNCSWRYDWNNEGQSTLDHEYVPIRQTRWWPSYETNNTKQNITHVLGFNEPDSTDQSNMTVAEAIAEWPNLMASGLRVGSPATTDGGLNWLYSFIDQADALNYRVDFVAVHYYKNNWSASQMYNWLRDIHLRTGRPLWVTEWNNGCNWTTPHPTYAQNGAKIDELITMLASAPFVERHSIFQWCTNREMFYSDGSITPAGVVYRDHVSPMANALDTNKQYVGYWRLDEADGITAADLSGNAAHGTLRNGLTFGDHSVPGMVGYALRFDGVNDYLELPAGFDNFNNGFSATFWASPSAVKNWGRFVDLGNGPANNNIIVAREATTNTLVVEVFNGTSGGGYVRAANALALNTWQFFAVTVDPRGHTNIYKNGQLIQTGTTGVPRSVWRSANYIGRSNWSADSYYQGDMDDIRLFNYALHADEVQTIYNIDTTARPYGGEAATIPGRIQAERFDLGGQAVGYRDMSLGNSGGAFRPEEDVDIRTIHDYGSGYAVTSIEPTEWLNYTVTVLESGTYSLSFRASTTAQSVPVTVKFNDTTVATVAVHSTGSMDAFETFVVNDVPLTIGASQSLRLEFSVGGLDVNWIHFEKQGPWGGHPTSLSDKIQAETFDIGGPGVAYYDTTPGNSGGAFRPYEDVDIVAVTDGQAGYAIDSIATGEWLVYTVNSAAEESDVYARVAATQDGGQIRVWLDDVLMASIPVPDTGSLTTWQTVSAACLPRPDREGAQLKLEFVGTGFRLNWIHFQRQMPYPDGFPHVIPGRIEFEDFDIGGQHISYYDNTLVNGYGGYRPLDFVDIMSVTDGTAGFCVYATASSLPEWLEYTCVIEPGVYTVVVRYACRFAGPQMTLSVGPQVLAAFGLPSTGNWGVWQNTIVPDVVLPGGEQTLRFTLTHSTAQLNYVDFIRQYNLADMTQSGRVDWGDFSLLAAQWMGVPGVPSADIAPVGGDGQVDLFDLLVLAENWLVVQ